MKTLFYKLGVFFMLGATFNTVSANELLDSTSDSQPNAAQLVDALNGTFGSHASFRASHAKGFFATGHFYPDASTSKLIDSKFFSEKKLPAIFRFSVGGGNPNISDKSRTVRGMSVEITSKSEKYDMVLISEPAFFAATLESFVSFLKARIPDPITKKPDPVKVAAHAEKYPESKIQPALLASHPAPFSYATTPYFSTNAFGFHTKKENLVWARIQVDPMNPLQYLNEQEEKEMPDNFLKKEFEDRLLSSYIKFNVFAQLQEDGDSLLDPTQIWQGKRKIKLGELHVEKIATSNKDDAIIFFPLQLPKGIRGSNDPILNARAAAYTVSASRRLQK
ncbi:catalase [Undibacterium crateris]|uniref:catalase n=1 Tax=Undibacterium crateris TaxID=2528175 RepID=UPI001389816A|nr:catalase [Undibacterium crateris]NDI87605.1 catalase [Undibacterium crateris]